MGGTAHHLCRVLFRRSQSQVQVHQGWKLQQVQGQVLGEGMAGPLSSWPSTREEESVGKSLFLRTIEGIKCFNELNGKGEML